MATTKKKTTKTAKTAASKAQDFAAAPINAKLSAEEKLDLYKMIVGIRRFEERSLQAYNQGKIGGFLHLYIGQEAVATGIVSLMEENDHIITAYRDHGHALAVGMSMNECMAEMYGKYTGCSKGKGGSMHFFAPDKNYWGGHGIVAGQTPLGAGLAFGLKYKGLKGCALAFLGDGAVNQGSFMETLNLASLWDLPVVFVIENNGYSMGTSLARSSAEENLAHRADGFDMEWEVCNGHDVFEVREVANRAMTRARETHKPFLLEIRTYRYRGHSVADANHEKYRTKEEIEEYKKTKDPINVLKAQLLADGTLTEELVKEINAEKKAEADASAKFADESPVAPREEIQTDVYWEVDNDTEGKLKGTYFFND
ncbi:pyruvate dehydrogenase (acetyl-transferring) E1 component subunit alpha [Coraliomargarita akajimensis]|uniref:Pyruvate dehydrogenase E1 component subunit alpha n=1 Tax=Coraliomargarita akajimensis (strain DSM 45221 / IAM 15411 / JCM 23193 / KCTC 12865 / 04OKA010-24) TaxID=583355 RepID=D5EM34_CORAD|nr:pyruvate dehydrogenase (acetyl-transferring) E1 component subunit alpha [Coraliomargarita akajimensis]ADE55194.1 pyruvate dehydrogenase (acetyl-transferring) E1 component, alpha subunit [Coraliomargarita akajimensis DSM 45221]